MSTFEITTLYRVSVGAQNEDDHTDNFNSEVERIVSGYDDVYLDNDSRYLWRWCWQLESTNRDRLEQALNEIVAKAAALGVAITPEIR